MVKAATDSRALFNILRCAENTDGQVGRSGMLKILLGQPSRKLAKLKLDHLEEYGALSFMRKATLLEHIDYLIERGCLDVSTIFFPMLDITDVGRERIKRMTYLHGLRILPEKPVTRLADRKIGATHVCDEMEFWYLFPQDLNNAKHEVIIVSPFISVKRGEGFMTDFDQFIARGAKVRIFVRPLGALRRREEAILNTWEGMGVEVIFRKGIHHKAAIIDRAIAWEGSLNILQHWNTAEQMTRHEDPEYVEQLFDVLNLTSKGTSK